MDKEYSGTCRDKPETKSDIARRNAEAIEAFKGVENWSPALLRKFGLPETRAEMLETLGLTEDDVSN